jgi:hypothetical protein
MTPNELRELCTAPSALSDDPPIFIVITMPGKWGKSDTRTIAGKGSPVGKIITDTVGENRIMVRFRAAEVLAWIDEMEAA